MKFVMIRPARAIRIFVPLLTVLLAGCQVVPRSEPAPPPPPTPAPPSSPPPAAAEPSLPWDVAPVAEGRWFYSASSGGSRATFGVGATPAPLSIRCVTATRQIVIALADNKRGGPLPVIIRTSSGVLNWQSVTSAAPRAVADRTITRPARDRGFDWIVYSRGRFSIEIAGERLFIVPVGAEIAHVVEDCRG